MGKKKMVMQRIAALLIASLVLTSTAFTSLAFTYYDLAPSSENVEVKVGETVDLTVSAVEKTASESIASKADSATALEEGVKWTITDGAENIKITQNGRTCTVEGVTAGTAVVTAENPEYNGKAVFNVTVSEENEPGPDEPGTEDPDPDKPSTVEPEVPVPEIPEDLDFEDLEEAMASIEEQTNQIESAINEAIGATNISSDAAKEVLNGLDGIPKDSELKLRSAKAALKVEKGEDGKPVVVVDALTYDISVVAPDGSVLPHDAMSKNTTPISIDIKLPSEGIKAEWRYAVVDHYKDEAALNAGTKLETLYSAIRSAEGGRYITIKSSTFSPFVMRFQVNDPNPTPSGGGGSSSGGGSRRHVVGGGSSTNSYSMTGNWVGDAVNGWKFVKSDGQNAVNTWGWINGQYYYFDAAGNMATGWQFINGHWYYLNATTVGVQGAMLTGVIFDPAYNAYFYADASGAMVTGWYQVGANWYYFSPVNDGVHVTGALLANTYVDGYYLGADGAWVPGN